VIGPTGTIPMLVATGPVDFRRGAEGLAALVREDMKADPFSGAIHLFRGRARPTRDILHTVCYPACNIAP